MPQLSDPIITLLIASASGLAALALKLCYSSKCKYIRCCGNTIERDTSHEAVINIDQSQRTPAISNNNYI